MSEELKLSDDQFWALERWIASLAEQVAMPTGFVDPARAQAISDTAYTALTGKDAGHD